MTLHLELNFDIFSNYQRDFSLEFLLIFNCAESLPKKFCSHKVEEYIGRNCFFFGKDIGRNCSFLIHLIHKKWKHYYACLRSGHRSALVIGKINIYNDRKQTQDERLVGKDKSFSLFWSKGKDESKSWTNEKTLHHTRRKNKGFEKRMG